MASGRPAVWKMLSCRQVGTARGVNKRGGRASHETKGLPESEIVCSENHFIGGDVSYALLEQVLLKRREFWTWGIFSMPCFECK